jgi:hypothetical protein
VIDDIKTIAYIVVSQKLEKLKIRILKIGKEAG